MSTQSRAMGMLVSDQWDAAHQLIQNESDPLSCQIHGLLHLIEGDRGNAAYWYQRAGLALPECSIESEKERLLSQAFQK